MMLTGISRLGDSLKGCENLEEVNISHNKLKDGTGLASNTKLKTADFSANSISDFSEPHLFS